MARFGRWGPAVALGLPRTDVLSADSGVMITLHGIWHDHRFHVWGDRREPPAIAAQAGAGAILHPGALPVEDLHAAVGELSADGLLASIAKEASLDLWLPVRDGVPAPAGDRSVSPVDADAGETFDLSALRVPTLVFTPAEVIDLLALLPEPIPRMCGDALRFWARLARYVLKLLARRQYVPDLTPLSGDEVRARWRVVVQSRRELHQLQRFADTMPPVCRAAVAGDGRNEPGALVESFLQICADATIRRSLAEDPFFHQIHDRAAGDAPWDVRWLSALMSEQAVLAGDGEGRTTFLNHQRGWVGRIDDEGADVPARLCFRLTPPPDPDDPDAGDPGPGDPDPDDPDPDAPDNLDDVPVRASDQDQPPRAKPWRLEFLLESLDGHRTLHDVAEVWSEASDTPALLRRNWGGRREHLIADLSRAAEVFPALEHCLHSQAPTGVDLSAVEAHTFIRHSAHLLEARGFGVRLPEWAIAPNRRLGLRLSLTPADDGTSDSVAPSRLGLGSMVDFEWQIAVGDTQLTMEEFEHLQAAQAPLVRLRGDWVLLDADAAGRAAAFLEQRRQGRMTLGQALRAAAGVEELDAGLPVFGVDGAAWIERLLRSAGDVKLEAGPQPEEFHGTLRPYQQRGLAWLTFMNRVGIGACLADDMGLGKTIQLIALLLEEQRAGENGGPTLVFAPMTVVGNWQREIERFAPHLRVLVHHGPERLAGDAFVSAADDYDVVVTTYALGHRDLESLRRVRWHRIALDEAQKIKNPSAAQTIAIKSLPSTHRLALTGTPLENHLSELWSIMEMLNPGLLGSAGDFRRRFAVPIERLGDRQRADQLKSLIRPFILRRVKNDPDVECDLPEKMEMPVYCHLTPEQAALYEQIVATTLAEVDGATGIRRRGVILAALTRLKQICNHPAHFLRDGSPLDGRSGKCERLVEMLEEVIAEGDAALIFTQFKEMGGLLVPLLTERLHTEVIFMHGGTPAKQRQQLVDRFQDPAGGVRIFLLSLRAGGLGLNLTAANHVFHFDRWWNPAVEAQATDRAYRIGQTRRVQVHKFVCMGTIEDRIDRMLTEKLALADSIVGSGDEWLTGMSTDELRKYLTLSRGAVGEISNGEA